MRVEEDKMVGRETDLKAHARAATAREPPRRHQVYLQGPLPICVRQAD